MKKFSLLLILTMLFASVFSSSVFANQGVSVFLNNEAVDPSHPPVFKNQRTMVSLDSEFFRKAGTETRFDKESGKIFIDSEYRTLELAIGEKRLLIQRKYDFTGIAETIEMDVAPFILDDAVYVPLRFVAESLGANVEWNGLNNSVSVTLDTGMGIVPVEKPVEYKEVNISELSVDDQLYAWVEKNKSNSGIFHKNINGKNYILICAGEKPTGGYSVDILSATLVNPGKVYIEAKINEPDPDMMVIQILTYPCKLIVIESDDEISVDGNIISSSDFKPEGIKFETVDPSNVTSDRELSAWVNEFYKKEGIHFKQVDDYVYVLVSAGEKNTGGYSVKVKKVILEQPGHVYVYAVVQSPAPGSIVTQAFTWPHTLIRFKGADIKQVKGEILPNISNKADF